MTSLRARAARPARRLWTALAARRVLTALAAALVLVGIATGYSVAVTGGAVTGGAVRAPASRAVGGAALDAEQAALLYRVHGGRVVVAPLEKKKPAAEDTVAKNTEAEDTVAEDTGLRCARFAAGGATRLCLTPGTGLLDHGTAVVLDSDLRERRRIALAGMPSRARVSRSGRLVSWTVFVRGDSYAGSAFSTWTSILDTRTGEYVANIESLELDHDGERYHSPDVNYWGVTFAGDDDRFYATVATRGRTYLVEASMEEWSARTLRENVECPSLSPDGRRVAFKQRVRTGVWRLAVLELATGRSHLLAEGAGIDDQALWLDDESVAYARQGAGIWAVPADGTGTPRRIAGGSSPAITSR